jgi:uncharacterized membrane protein
VDPSGIDDRQVALIMSRARCVVGIACIAAPSLVARLVLGASTPATKAATRVTGIRDLALGVGALTAIKEHQHDAEWMSMGAACDGFDALVFALSPRLPKRARLIGLVAGASGAYLMKLSRDFAAARETDAAAGTPV